MEIEGYLIYNLTKRICGNGSGVMRGFWNTIEIKVFIRDLVTYAFVSLVVKREKKGDRGDGDPMQLDSGWGRKRRERRHIGRDDVDKGNAKGSTARGGTHLARSGTRAGVARLYSHGPSLG
ncbi:hypothetical protein E2562_027249 [Oryza meyeriana var. granulata]|uniref:Uncharacterized protein n=1 Tax=Oryza meyeriana var. granulata TaxID=110450 RepID=A0A6G1CTH7_9ORYZ|nr:hypothetical protein E2562_027249 [Oryza meyeriana var. granulata]